MLFQDIVGNIKTKQELIDTVLNNRISNSLLFYGNTGSAKLPLAIAYAQLLNCEKIYHNDSCGTCSSCLKYNNLTHPDLHFIFPVWKIKSQQSVSDMFVDKWRDFFKKNKYGNLNDWADFVGPEKKTNHQGKIYKDEAENIHQKISLKNYEARYRVILIWMPEQMELRTSNKLLKMLEEPPERTVFILVSADPNQLLPTINSRLQKIRINDFVAEDIVEFFSTNKISLENAKQLKNITGGDLGRIAKLINEATIDEDLFEDYKSWLRLCYRADVEGAADFSNTISLKERKSQKLFLSYIIKMTRESIIYNFANKSLLQASKKEQEFLVNFSPFIHEENSCLIVDKIEKSIKEINRNANSKILFFELSLQMMKFLKVKRKFAIK